MKTPLDKAIQAAYDYHPYGMGLCQSNGWTIGPTFIVTIEPVKRSSDSEPLPELASGSSTLRLMVNSILAQADDAVTPVWIDKSGHPKEQKFRKDRYGSLHPMSAAKCTCRAIHYADGQPTGMEMPFPLLSLAKKLKSKRYTVHAEAIAQIHAWTDEGLVGVFQGKYVQPDCLLPLTLVEAA